ncbi:MAG: hypothetical protein KOO60_01870 [Gemmatimonadales bacterium]|nr:hypothetical protein [Gemmatimonadales bacterium]
MDSTNQYSGPATPLLPKGKTLILLLIAGLLFVLHTTYYWSWVEDDSYISFQYAENLVQGHGLVFNSGERVEGYSNFAWVLLASLALKLGFLPLLVAKVVGVIGGLVALFFSWLLALKLKPRSGLSATLAPFFLAATPLLPRHAVTGLETALFAALLAVGLVFASGEIERRFNPAVPVLLFVLALLRPEGVAFALLVLFWRVWGYSFLRVLPESLTPIDGYYSSLPSSKKTVFELMLFLILFISYFLWRWHYFGALLPNTFHAKMTGEGRALFEGLNYTLDFLRENGGVALVGLFLSIFLGRGLPALFWPLAGAIAVHTVFVILAGGDWMHFYRFFVPVMPLLAAGMAAGMGTLFDSDKAKAEVPCRGQTVTLRVIMAVILLTSFMGIYKSERAASRLVMPAVRSGSYLTDGYRQAAFWVRENTPVDSSIAVCDIGILGYLSQRRIIDMFGLIDPHIARTPGRPHFKSDADHVLAQDPDTVILVSEGPGQYLRVPDASLFGEAEFHSRFTMAHSIGIGFRNEVIQIFQRID